MINLSRSLLVLFSVLPFALATTADATQFRPEGSSTPKCFVGSAQTALQELLEREFFGMRFSSRESVRVQHVLTGVTYDRRVWVTIPRCPSGETSLHCTWIIDGVRHNVYAALQIQPSGDASYQTAINPGSTRYRNGCSGTAQDLGQDGSFRFKYSCENDEEIEVRGNPTGDEWELDRYLPAIGMKATHQCQKL